ncbi:helix-loop-helix DNA-binding domain-containing protein [Dichotomocladium elegans]|nr:helix-loop-helix DNA-binding domain-containing protein [Dichotomocladium elegans]
MLSRASVLPEHHQQLVQPTVFDVQHKMIKEQQYTPAMAPANFDQHLPSPPPPPPPQQYQQQQMFCHYQDHESSPTLSDLDCSELTSSPPMIPGYPPSEDYLYDHPLKQDHVHFSDYGNAMRYYGMYPAAALEAKPVFALSAPAPYTNYQQHMPMPHDGAATSFFSNIPPRSQPPIAAVKDPLEDDLKAQANLQAIMERRRIRRQSHNAVERRRRDNINDRIKELGSLLPQSLTLDEGGVGRLNKGTILRKSVDHIKLLKRDLSDYQHRVRELEATLQSLGAHVQH